MAYLCSTPYTPHREHGISPLDPALDLPWPSGPTPALSEKDAAAPTLALAREQGLLPDLAACEAWYARLRRLTP